MRLIANQAAFFTAAAISSLGAVKLFFFFCPYINIYLVRLEVLRLFLRFFSLVFPSRTVFKQMSFDETNNNEIKILSGIRTNFRKRYSFRTYS